MTQRIISCDSTILNTLQACARKCDLSFNKNVHTVSKASPLERGDLMHKMLEIYYALKGDCFRLNSPVWTELTSAGLIIPTSREHMIIVNFATACGRYFATQMELEADDVESVYFQFKEYCIFNQHDNWIPLAVEEVGSKVLFENEDFKFIYNFKIDLIAQQGNNIVPWDHKTSKRREEVSDLSNQFIGYAWALNLEHVLVNKIGFQKTLKPGERFQRFILNISSARRKEWQQNTINWMFQLVNNQNSDNWPMNLTSCDKYNGCLYKPLCSADPESREYKIERDYKIGDSWDVAHILEAKES